MKNGFSVLLLLQLAYSNLYGQIDLQRRVNFDSDLASLNMHALMEIDEFNKQLRALDPVNYLVLIQGEIKIDADFNYQQRLTLKRLQTTREYLIAKGLDSNKIEMDCNGIISHETKGNIHSQLGEINIELKLIEAIKEPIIIARKKETRYGRQGTTVIFDDNAFAPYSASEIKIDINEAFDLGSLISYNWPTISKNGVCLSSAGSVYIKALMDSNEVQLINGKIRVEMPIRNELIEDELALWNSHSAVLFSGWEIDSNLTFKLDTESRNFVFETNKLGGYGVQFVNTTSPQLSLNALLPDQWIAKHLNTIHSKEFQISEMYLVDRSNIMMIKSEQINRHTGVFPACAFQSNSKILAFSWMGSELFMAHIPLSDAKYQPLFGRYILEKEDFKRINPSRKERILANL